MENQNLLKDTIIEEALAYSGEFEPVLNTEKILIGTEIGEMLEIEKRLHTLSALKNQEIIMMFGNIIGYDIETDPRGGWVMPLAKIISIEKNQHYFEKFNRLEKEAEACKELMWILIRLRYNHIRSVLAIRPGFKIIAIQNSEETFLPDEKLSGLN